MSCNLYCSVFSVVPSKAAKDRKRKQASLNKSKKELSPANNSLPVDRLKSSEHSSDQGNIQVDVKDSLDHLTEFPPKPVDINLSHKIVSDFCENLKPDALEEAGCMVCGQLVPVAQLTRLKAVKNLLHVLHASGVTRLERSSSMQPIREIKGPVLDYTCTTNCICDNCRQCLRNGKTPPYALAS